MLDTKKNYKIQNFVIKKSFCYWKYYFKQPYRKVEIITKYSNFGIFVSIYKLI